MKRLLFALMGGVAVLGLVHAGRVEAAPEKEYPITREAGAWMILAARYTGPNAYELARQVAQQLRQRDNLPAYIFNRNEEEQRKQKEYLEQIRRLAPDAKVKIVRIPDEYAVLVGGYPDMDTARKALDKVKKLKLPEFKDLPPDINPYDYTIDPKTGQRFAINPFAGSFVVRNPTVPQEKAADPDKLDAFTKELNSGECYSLLQCKKPYTLVIKVFEGTNMLQSKSTSSTFLDKIGMGSKTGELLSASGLQAHELARVLREEMKLDAYVLHTRHNSVVTVGSFDSENEDQVQKVRRQVPIQFGPVQMLPQPFVWKVPR